MNFPRGFLTQAAVKAVLALQDAGPRQCCADWAIVTDCDGETDYLWCGLCDFKWTRPCSVSDLVS